MYQNKTQFSWDSFFQCQVVCIQNISRVPKYFLLFFYARCMRKRIQLWVSQCSNVWRESSLRHEQHCCRIQFSNACWRANVVVQAATPALLLTGATNFTAVTASISLCLYHNSDASLRSVSTASATFALYIKGHVELNLLQPTNNIL